MKAPQIGEADGVLFEVRDGAARIVLNRPQAANALHGPALRALARAVEAAKNDPRARALTLDGAGRNFCAGADINWMLDAPDDSRNLAATRALSALLLSIRKLPKPALVFARGGCVGGGAGLCAAADIVVADPTAVFAFREVRMGIVPAVIAPYVVERVGPARARRLFITGERVDAETAAAIGLIDQVADPVRFPNPRGCLEEILENLRRCGPNAMAVAKRLPGEIAGTPIGGETAEKTANLLAEIRATPEAREGLSAFLEKRPPAWTGEGAEKRKGADK